MFISHISFQVCIFWDNQLKQVEKKKMNRLLCLMCTYSLKRKANTQY